MSTTTTPSVADSIAASRERILSRFRSAVEASTLHRATCSGAAATPTPRFARGIISVNAEPGVVYRNFGEIKLCSATDIVRHFERTDDPMVFDLSGLSSYFDIDVPKIPNKPYVLGSINNGIVSITADAVEDCSYNFNPSGVRESRVSVKITSKSGYSYPHIWRDADRGFNFGFRSDFSMPEISAPSIKSYDSCCTVSDFIDDLSRAGVDVEIQKCIGRRRVYRSKQSGLDDRSCYIPALARWNFDQLRRGSRWVKKEFRSENIRNGLYRVRYRTKRRQSPWSYFYYVKSKSLLIPIK